MFKQILHAHWRASQLMLLPLTVGAFALPVLSVSTFSFAYFNRWSVYYPSLAVLTGMAIAAASWHWDHMGKHVYARTLPIAPWRYALMRMGAGGLSLLVPVAALWVGAVVASLGVNPPAGIHAYPHSLAFRFLNATAIAYAGWFALFTGKQKTQVAVLASLLGFFAVSGFIASFTTLDLSQKLADFMVKWPGPFEVFTGSWRLLDV